MVDQARVGIVQDHAILEIELEDIGTRPRNEGRCNHRESI